MLTAARREREKEPAPAPENCPRDLSERERAHIRAGFVKPLEIVGEAREGFLAVRPGDFRLVCIFIALPAAPAEREEAPRWRRDTSCAKFTLDEVRIRCARARS